MHPVRPPHAFDQREQPDVIDDGIAAASIRSGVARAVHHKLTPSLDRESNVPSSASSSCARAARPGRRHQARKHNRPWHAPLAAFRAAAKSSTQTKSNTRAPNERANSTRAVLAAGINDDDLDQTARVPSRDNLQCFLARP